MFVIADVKVDDDEEDGCFPPSIPTPSSGRKSRETSTRFHASSQTATNGTCRSRSLSLEASLDGMSITVQALGHACLIDAIQLRSLAACMAAFKSQVGSFGEDASADAAAIADAADAPLPAPPAFARETSAACFSTRAAIAGRERSLASAARKATSAARSNVDMASASDDTTATTCSRSRTTDLQTRLRALRRGLLP